MKYKILSVIIFLLAGLEVLLPALLVSSVLPRLAPLYQEAGMKVSNYLYWGYLEAAVIFLIGALNAFIGYKLWRIESQQRYFKWGLILVITTFFLAWFLNGLLVISTILPIYQLTSSIK